MNDHRLTQLLAVFEENGPPLPFIDRIAARVLGLREAARLTVAARSDTQSRSFLGAMMRQLEISVELSGNGLAGIPRSGGTIVVANHPFGAVEGMALHELCCTARSDVRTMAVHLLGVVPEVRAEFIMVDPFEHAAAAHNNRAPMRAALQLLRRDGMLAMFPSAAVSRFIVGAKRVVDPPWRAAVGSLARASGATVIPVHVAGRNSIMFQALGLLHPVMHAALIVREILNKRGRTIHLAVGDPIPAREILAFGTDKDIASELQRRTYALAELHNHGHPRTLPTD